MDKKRISAYIGAIAILVATIFWGTAFAQQRLASQYLGALTLNSTRFLLGGLILVPFVLATAMHRNRTDGTVKGFSGIGGKRLLAGGVVAGLALFLAAYLQQKGLETTSAGKSGFLTTLYIVLVPIFSVALKKRTTLVNWIGIAIALGGMYLMCMTGPFRFETGDLYLIGCAVMFAVQILVIDVLSVDCDPLAFSCVQELTCGLVGLIPALLVEKPTMRAIMAARTPLLFLAVFSCAIAYTLQVVGQRKVPAQAATLLMSLEAVFASIAGVILLGERMSVREMIGAALIFAAVLLVELYQPKKEATPPSAAGKEPGD